MKTCQFCAEEINEKAVKCKHCGSDLRQNRSMETNISDNARAFVKAQKVKEAQDVAVGLGVFVFLVIGFVVGGVTGNFWVGLIVFFVLILLLSKWWYRE